MANILQLAAFASQMMLSTEVWCHSTTVYNMMTTGVAWRTCLNTFSIMYTASRGRLACGVLGTRRACTSEHWLYTVHRCCAESCSKDSAPTYSQPLETCITALVYSSDKQDSVVLQCKATANVLPTLAVPVCCTLAGTGGQHVRRMQTRASIRDKLQYQSAALFSLLSVFRALSAR